MNIHYISHATLLIEAGDLRIVTDPWFAGPAYCGQWHLFPKPVNTELLGDADVILLSHGHEDHLHDPTLRRMPNNATIFYPYSWYGGIKGYLSGLRFTDIREAITGREYRLDADTTVTYVANNLDSIIVIQHRDEVFVNVNDSLHAFHPNVIDTFVAVLKERWPRIDILFCGFGGASYFPNAVHAPDKDDMEIAQLREQLFLHNFCRIVQGLAPRVAVPFAADFALLAPWQRWINSTRYPRHQIAEYYRAEFDSSASASEIIPMYSGDLLEDGSLIPSSPYRDRMIDGSLDHLIDEQYAPEIAMHQVTLFVPERRAVEIHHGIATNVRKRRKLFKREQIDGLAFTIVIEDVERDNYFNVRIDDDDVMVTRSCEIDPASLLLMRTTSAILEYSFASEWGGDAITIGYGAEIFLFDSSTAERGLDSICVRLLTRHPSTTRHMKKEPLRAARFLASNPITRAWGVQQFLHPARNLQEVAPRREWLLRTKCEICRICDLPLLDARFSAAIRT
jgi:hypothetical protein